MKPRIFIVVVFTVLFNLAIAQEQNVTQRIDTGINEVKNLTANIESTKNETNTQMKRLDELNHQARCAAQFNAIAEHFIKFMSTEVNGDRADSLKNLQLSYTSQQTLFFENLKQELGVAANLPNDARNLAITRGKIQDNFRPNALYEIKIRQSEEALHTKLSWISANSNGYLTWINSNQFVSCADLQERMPLLLGKVKQVSDIAREQTLRLGKLSLLRQRLREDLGNTLALRATKEAAEETSKSIDEVLSLIDEAYRGEQLIKKMEEFWSSSATGRRVGNLVSQKFQYFAALLAMEADLAKLDSFIEEASTFSSPKLRSLLEDQGNGFKKTVESRISEVKKEGWKKQFDRQKALAAASLTQARRLNDFLCTSATKFQLDRLDLVSTEEDFARVESGYLEVFAACQKH